MKTRHIVIQLPKGGTLEVNVTDEFMNLVAKHFEVSVDDVTHDDIRMFLHAVSQDALNKAQQ